MKYQIYLNKETSELLNSMAEQLKMKPSTFIKAFIEGSFNTLISMKEDSESVKMLLEAFKHGNR